MKTKWAFAAGVLYAAIPLCAGAAVLRLPFPFVQQEHSQWCWAADASAILRYRGVSRTQCAIANWALRVQNACGPHPFEWNDKANSPNALSGPTGTSGVLSSLGGRQSQYHSGPLSYAATAAAISGRNPVMITWKWSTSGAHAVVLYGYDDSTKGVYYMDPWPGEGDRYGVYNWIVSGGQHTWVESLTTY
jgi:hypothetical protein